jgi:hypothetical protein
MMRHCRYAPRRAPRLRIGSSVGRRWLSPACSPAVRPAHAATCSPRARTAVHASAASNQGLKHREEFVGKHGISHSTFVPTELVRSGPFVRINSASARRSSTGRREANFSHLDQPGPAAVAIDQAQDRPHDQTPFSISGTPWRGPVSGCLHRIRKTVSSEAAKTSSQRRP